MIRRLRFMIDSALWRLGAHRRKATSPRALALQSEIAKAQRQHRATRGMKRELQAALISGE